MTGRLNVRMERHILELLRSVGTGCGAEEGGRDSAVMRVGVWRGCGEP